MTVETLEKANETILAELESEEAKAISDIYEYYINFIKENYVPVEDKPGYVWFDKRNFQIISIETLAKALEN